MKSSCSACSYGSENYDVNVNIPKIPVLPTTDKNNPVVNTFDTETKQEDKTDVISSTTLYNSSDINVDSKKNTQIGIIIGSVIGGILFLVAVGVGVGIYMKNKKKK